jgi:hypothetical protein
VIGAAAPQRVSVELGTDPHFERRIRRLAVVSAIALGLICGLAVATLDAPAAVAALLGAGWLLMPATLAASVPRPRLRYALVLPATLVSLGLLAICVGWLPGDPAAAAGWLLLTAGIAVGGGLGLWFWFRLLPVPARLDDPFSTGRWALIGIHVGLVVAGFGLAAQALVR